MQLEAITVGLVRQAIVLYDLQAWNGEGEQTPALAGDDDAPFEACSGAFRDETQAEGGYPVRRYSIRLGNPRYPFMKLVLQELCMEQFKQVRFLQHLLHHKDYC